MRLILHIGQHKTGSKALQWFLSSNHDRLVSHQYLYSIEQSDTSCHAYQHSHYHFYRELRSLALSASNSFNFSNLDSDINLRTLADILRNDMNNAKERGCHTLVLSAEDIFTMHTAHELGTDDIILECAIHILKQVIANLNIDLKVLIYLRDTMPFLVASYAQYIKGASRGTLGIKEFFFEFRDRLYPQRFLERWQTLLDPENLQIRRFNENRNEFDIRKDFIENVLNVSLDGFSFDLPHSLSDRREICNKTPNLMALSILRFLNKYPIFQKYLSRELVLDFSTFLFK